MTNYASHGTGSDSGTEPHGAGSPQSLSDAGPVSTYGHHHALPAPVYVSQPDQSGVSMAAASDLRVVMPPISQPYSAVGAYSYPAICQPQNSHGLVASTSRTSWEMHSLGASTPSTTTAYGYIDPVYPIHDGPQGH